MPASETNPKATATAKPVPLRTPIEGPSAWIGADMRERETEWSYRLSSAEIAEIETAVQAVQTRGLDIAESRRDDFPLPMLGPVLDRMRTEVLDGRGFVLLRGLPVEDRPIIDSATAYWGIGTYFGGARSQNAQGHLLGMSTTLAKGSARRTPICAAMRLRSAKISTSTAATSSRCCACGAPNQADSRRSSAR